MDELQASDFSGDATFPLKNWGMVWYVGWDIPGWWAVDADGRGWADFGAHGRYLRPYSVDDIIRHLDDNGQPATANIVRQLVGRKPKMPEWAREALRAGWAPPASFDADAFEP